jgi:hypothetical protein
MDGVVYGDGKSDPPSYVMAMFQQLQFSDEPTA